MKLALYMGWMILAVACLVPCQGSEPDSFFIQNADIPQIRVGYLPNETFIKSDTAGKCEGYAFDYLRELRNYHHWDFAFEAPSATREELFKLLRQGRIDMIPGIRKNPQNEQEFAFSKHPLIHIQSVMILKATETRFQIQKNPHWNGIRVGFVEHSPQIEDFARFAQSQKFTYDSVMFENLGAMEAALQAGECIDAMVTNSLRKIKPNEWAFQTFDGADLYIALSPKNTALLENLDQAMEQFESEFPDIKGQLWRKHYAHVRNGQLHFNENERAFLEKIQKMGYEFRCALHPDRKPFSWYDKGEFHGIFKDYADEISKRTGLKFRFSPIKNHEEYVTLCQNRNIDIIWDLVANSTRSEYKGLRLTKPYFSASVAMLQDKNAGNTIKTIGLLSSEDWDLRAPDLFPNAVNVQKFDTIEALVDAVKSPHVDAAYLYTRSAEYAVYNDVKAQLILNYVPRLENAIAMGIQMDCNPLLSSILNKAIMSMDDTFSNHLRAKYIPKFKEVFSIVAFFHKYPKVAMGVPTLILVMFSLFFAYIFSRRKKTYQIGLLFNKFPLRCFVISGQEQFLFYTLGQRSHPGDEPMLRCINDIPEANTRDIMREKTQLVLADNQTRTAEFYYEGEYRTAIVAKLPDSAYGKNCVIWISQDTTELQRSRDEIRKREEFFRLTLNSIGDGAITTDAQGNVVLLNPVAEKMTGVSSVEAQGRSHEEIFRIVDTTDGTPLTSPLRKALETGETIQLSNHTNLMSFDGSVYNVADCASPIRDAKGEIVGAVLIFRDVTQIYCQREALKESVSNWEKASEIAKLYTFRMNNVTRKELNDNSRLNAFWPIVDGKLVSFKDWVIADDVPKFNKVYEALRSGRKKDFELTYRANDNGTLRHFRIFGRIDENNPKIITGLVQDITEWVDTVNELQAIQLKQTHQQEYQDVLNKCLNVFIDSDYMNVPFEEILEIVRKYLGASYCYVLHCDTKTGLTSCYAEVTKEGLPQLYEKEGIIPFEKEAPWFQEFEVRKFAVWGKNTPQGVLPLCDKYWENTAKVHHIHALWAAAITPAGKIWGNLGVAYDEHSDKNISAKDIPFINAIGKFMSLIMMRCISRDNLIDALEQAKAADKAKSFFLASMSHEIRTPLNAVIGLTELLKDGDFDYDTQQEYLENIYISGNALLQLINDILDLSKLEAEQMPIFPKPTDFSVFCNEICRTFQYSANKKALNFFVNISDTIPPLMMDKLRIRQILFNLIGNAIKFTKKGSVRLTASFSSSSAFEGALWLQIADTGIGIMEEDRKKIFEPFVQLSKMRGTNASNCGTGLGLVIVHKLVEKMGGTLSLESEEGKGSTFSIVFPQVAIADAEVLGESRNNNRASESQLHAPATATPIGAQLRVLVVDDVPMNIKVLEPILKRLNIDVVEATSGAMALQLLQEEAFDWVLTDWMMPEMNGEELAKAIRQETRYNTLRVGLITAETDGEKYNEGLFDGVLIKPIDIQTLQETLFRSNKHEHN